MSKERIIVRYNEIRYKELLNQIEFVAYRLSQLPELMEVCGLQYTPESVNDLFFCAGEKTRQQYEQILNDDLLEIKNGILLEKLKIEADYSSCEIPEWVAESRRLFLEEKVSLNEALKYIDLNSFGITREGKRRLKEESSYIITDETAIARYQAHKKAVEAINEYLALWPDGLICGKIHAFNSIRYNDNLKKAVLMPIGYENIKD